MDSLTGLSAAISAVAEGDELILYTSDWNAIGWAVNLVRQLAVHSLDRRALLLADKRSTCERALGTWPWLWCGWSRGIPGFERYAVAGAGVIELWTLWSAKWLVLARLVEQRVNVLMTDADVLLLASPYPLLTAAPLDRFVLVVPPEGARVNVGWLYARGANASGGGLVSLLWDVVRRLRLFLQQTTLRDQQGHPSVAGLWDQGLFSDAFASAVEAEHSYAFTWLHSPQAFAEAGAFSWPPRGFSAANASSLLGRLWKRSRDMKALRPRWLLPPLPRRHPQRGPWERPEPLLWNALRPLDARAGLRSDLLESRPDLLPGGLGWLPRAAAPTGSLHSQGSVDMVGGAPDWLHCTTGWWMLSAGWPASRRPVCTVLHLVECRSQFAHFGSLDTLKRNRPYVLGAYGHWYDEANAHTAPPTTQLTERGAGPLSTTRLRAVRLGPELLQAAAASSGVGVLLNALQLLSMVAALTGRVPVIPKVDCTSSWLKRQPFTIGGVADDYVLQLREQPATEAAEAEAMEDDVADAVSCHLAIGGAGCQSPQVLPGWHRVQGETSPLEMPAVELLVDEAGSEARDVVAREEVASQPAAHAAVDARGSHLHAESSAASTGVYSERLLRSVRTQAARHADSPMFEIRWPTLARALAQSAIGQPRAGRPGAATHPMAEAESHALALTLRRFRCGVSTDVETIGQETLEGAERRRLEQLQAACPAFFARRGSKRRRLSWLHRRRRIRGAEPECEELSEEP